MTVFVSQYLTGTLPCCFSSHHLHITCLSLSLFSFLQVERCYYFLQACVETAQRKEPVDGRLVQFLLSNPTNDGGQWDMLVNLIGQSSSRRAIATGGPSSDCVNVFVLLWSCLFRKVRRHSKEMLSRVTQLRGLTQNE